MKYFLDTEFLEGTQKTLFGQSKPTIDLISIGIVAEDGREYYAISKEFNLKEAWNRWQQRTGEGDSNNIEPRLYWLRENVLKSIYKELHSKENLHARQAFYRNVYITETNFDFTYKNLKRLIKKYGKTNKQIAEEIIKFCQPIEGNTHHVETDSHEKVNVGRDNEFIPAKRWTEIIGNRTAPQFYGYYCDYDWVVFCWLFGKMINLPKGFPMYCIDLKQELDYRVSNMSFRKQLLGRIGQEDVEGVTFVIEYGKDNLSKYLDLVKGEGLFKGTYPKQTNEHNALADAKWNKQLHEFLNTL